MKKYRVCATVSFYTEVVVKAENKQSAYDIVEGIISFDDLLLGRPDSSEDDVTDIVIKRIKKNEQRR
ncbi:MAG: hypothetical protein KAS32_01445 [Candidatus Peribacteraceae bacterium]|nr:hypothetical protein [Candidatus Peribacteraceae bacterium]